MNTLQIDGITIQFNTNEKTYREAQKELEEALERIGAEYCGGYNGVLLDEDGREID